MSDYYINLDISLSPFLATRNDFAGYAGCTICIVQPANSPIGKSWHFTRTVRTEPRHMMAM